MEEKKKIGNAQLLIVAFVLTVAIIFGSTYAWIRLTKTSTIENKITAGDLELVLDDTTSDGIKLEKAIPISDAEGEKGTEYTFTLENKGTVDLTYYLYLNDLDLAEGETRLEDNKVRYKLVKDEEILTATNVDRIIFVEGNFTFDFDPQTHKFSNVVQSDGSTVTGLADYLNGQLSETSTFDDAYQIVKKTLGLNYTYKIVRQSNSKLLSTVETKGGRILDNGRINSNQKITYKLQIWIDKNAETEIMGKIFNAQLNIESTQYVPPALCKRATTLHTETCRQTDSSHYCSGDGYTASGSMKTTTITYGNLGTKGTLTSGDAFDCDVNGDGVYDSATERFYYVSDMTNGVTQNSNVAVLVYYNNVSGGVAANSIGYAYDESRKSNNGPVTAIKQLPTTSQWSNVNLTNTTRAITNQNGGNTTGAGNLPTAFSYEGYAARLLTYQEVYSECYDETTKVLSKKCKYLIENTEYSSKNIKILGYWLESPLASYSDLAWDISAYFSDFAFSTVTVTNGVRPAIEVAKKKIDY